MMRKKVLFFIIGSLVLLTSVITISIIQEKSKTPNQESKKVIAKINEYLETNEKDVNAHMEIGRLYFHEQQYEKAIKHYEKVIDIDPYNELAWHRMGNVYVFQNNFEDARKVRERVIEIESPRSASSLYYLSTIDLLFDPASALTHAKQALQIAKEDKTEKIELYQSWYRALKEFNNLTEKGEFAKAYLSLAYSGVTLEKPLWIAYLDQALNKHPIMEGVSREQLLELKEKILSYEANLVSLRE